MIQMGMRLPTGIRDVLSEIKQNACLYACSYALDTNVLSKILMVVVAESHFAKAGSASQVREQRVI